MTRRKSIKTYKSRLLIYYILLIFGFYIIPIKSQAQISENSLIALKKEGKIIINANQAEERIKANKSFLKILRSILQEPESFRFSFDSISNMAALCPTDSSFRIYNWMLIKDWGEMEFFGFIQMKPKNNKCITTKLIDKSSEIKKPQQSILSSNNWFGALYYKIIENTYKGEKTYTLLGWNGKNNHSNIKLIDILQIDKDGSISFGKKCFSNLPMNSRRIFEFHEQTSMSLKYEKQAYYKSIERQRKGKEDIDFLISFTRLYPLSPQLEGQYDYYYPSANVVDAYVFDKGQWVFYEHIDARNNTERQKKATQKPSELDLFKKTKQN